MRLTLEFSLPDSKTLDAGNLHPGSLCQLRHGEIESQPIWVDGKATHLGQVCQVSQEADYPDELVLLGETRKCAFIGRGLGAGQITVPGDAGYAAGAEMSGGELVIHGSAGDCLGSGMRKGLIWVGGNAGKSCAENLHAGSIFCAGEMGRYAGIGMKRGSLVAERLDGILPGFFPAGMPDNEWLLVSFKSLEEMGIAVPLHWKTRKPACFTGDHLELGKGEILVYAKLE